MAFFCINRYVDVVVFKIQINDQDREFVNKISKELKNSNNSKNYEYHPQANGLVDRIKQLNVH